MSNLKAMSDAFVRHLPAIVMAVVLVLNVLVKDNSLHMSDAVADTLNVLLGLLGIGAHVNNHR